MTTKIEKADYRHLFEGKSLGISEVWQRALTKHERYLTEAEVARSLETRGWRTTLATSLRRLADHLESSYPLGAPTSLERHAASGLGVAQRRTL